MEIPLGNTCGHLFCLEGEISRCVIMHQFMRLLPMDWLEDDELGKCMIRKLVKKIYREDVNRFFSNGQRM